MAFYYNLNSGYQMPCLGLGMYKITSPDEVQQTIADAVSIGYRLFDTASSFKNEADVGEGIRNCGIPREELFITTKIWNTAQRIGNIEDALVWKEEVQKAYPDHDIVMDPLSLSVSCHIGPGSIAIVCMKKLPDEI